MANHSGGQDDLFGGNKRFASGICELAAQLGPSSVRKITRAAVRLKFWTDEDNEDTLVKAHIPDVERALRGEDKAGLPQFAPRADGLWIQRVLFTLEDYDAQIKALVKQVKDDQRSIRRWQAEMLHRYGQATNISSIYREDDEEDI